MFFCSKKDRQIEILKRANKNMSNEIKRLKNLCAEKDSFFCEMISDGLRHKSKLAAKHMRDRKDYLKWK